MTREEFVKKYDIANREFIFDSYYKYSFTFQAKDMPELTVTWGGEADDIYRYDVSRDGIERFDGDDIHEGHCGDDSFYDY